MSGVKIDHNTCNLTMEVNTGDKGLTTILLPPADAEEVKSNAMVLGAFSVFLDEVGPLVLLTDWDVYMKEAIEKVSESKSNKDKFIEDSTIKINALLERSIQGAYYYDKDNGYEPKSCSELDETTKSFIKGKLLFFIVLSRYVRPHIPMEEWLERVELLNMSYTSLNATDYKTSFLTQSSKRKTSAAK